MCSGAERESKDMAEKYFRVVIGGKSYKVHVDPKDEGVLRRAARVLNDKIAEMQGIYNCSDRDFIALAALLISIESEEEKLKRRYSDDGQELDELLLEVNRALE